jgi:hypothetical protein
MTGTSCAFILAKSLNLPLYYSSFFLHMYDYAILDSGYREASSLLEDLIQEMLKDLLQA